MVLPSLSRSIAKQVAGSASATVVTNVFQKQGLAKQASDTLEETLRDLEKECGEFPNRKEMFQMVEAAHIRDPHYFKQNIRRIRDLIPAFISEQMTLHQQVKTLKADKEMNPEVVDRIEHLYARPYLLSQRYLKPYPHAVYGVLPENNTFVECNLSTLRNNLAALKTKYGRNVVAYLQTLGLYDFQTVAAARLLAEAGCLLVSNSTKTAKMLTKELPGCQILVSRCPITDVEVHAEIGDNIIIACEDVPYLNAADSAGKTLGHTVKIYLEVAYDQQSTGIPYDQVEQVISNLKDTHPMVILEGIYCNPAEGSADLVAAEFAALADRVKQYATNPDRFAVGMSNGEGTLNTLPPGITHLMAGRQLWGIHSQGGVVDTKDVGADTVTSVRSKAVNSKKTATTNKEVLPAGPGLPRIFMGSREGLDGPANTKWGITNRKTKEMIVDGQVTTVSVGVDYSWVTERSIKPKPLLPVTIHGTAGTGKSVFLTLNEMSNIPRHIPRTLYDADAWGEDALETHLQGLRNDRSELVEVLLEDLIATEQQGLLWFYAEPKWQTTLPYRAHVAVPRDFRQTADIKFKPQDYMLNHRFQATDLLENQPVLD